VSDRRTLAPFGRRRLEVVDARDVGAYRLFAAADPEGPEPRPGQFYMLAAQERWGGGHDERPWLPRAFSFLRARGGVLEFLLEEVGPGTARLAELAPGDGLLALGPLGVGFAAPGPGRRAVLCGGGIGVVPLAGWEDALEGAATTLLGFRGARHAEAAHLFAAPRLATDDGSTGHHGLVTELLAREIDAGVVVYACGPPPMLEAVRALCAERDVPGQLALETGMACGYGACFGCAVATRQGYIRLCLEGPVLDAGALEAVHA
jgi:dihydroorotate dehydrogenase electron transfer subunit